MGEKNTKFCRRILIFLSQGFPLEERSGVNSRGGGMDHRGIDPSRNLRGRRGKEGEGRDKMAVVVSPGVLEGAKKDGAPLSVLPFSGLD